eukprot:362289-Chlamydomonas_euryale.AAC.4
MPFTSSPSTLHHAPRPSCLAALPAVLLVPSLSTPQRPHPPAASASDIVPNFARTPRTTLQSQTQRFDGRQGHPSASPAATGATAGQGVAPCAPARCGIDATHVYVKRRWTRSFVQHALVHTCVSSCAGSLR